MVEKTTNIENLFCKQTLDIAKKIHTPVAHQTERFSFWIIKKNCQIVGCNILFKKLVENMGVKWPLKRSYLWGILGQWDILLLNLTSIGFTNFFRCLIFDLSFFTNADVVTIKDETSKENSWNRCRSYWLPLVSQIFLDVSSLSFSFLQMLML